MHSNFSDDGEFTPTELVKQCVKEEITYFAITDHNSISGLAEGKEAALKYNVCMIPGIELDCSFMGVNLHLLGYGIKENLSTFTEIEENILVQEQANAFILIKKIRDLGIPFSQDKIESLSKNGVVTGEMVAEAAMEYEGARENPQLKPYFPGGDRSDNPFVNFYWDYCSQGKPAYVKTDYISLEDGVKAIVKASGVPILAHPGNNVKEDQYLLNGIMNQGVIGIEVYSSYHKDQQTKFYESYAAEHGFIMTCGSDYHGKTKPSIGLGSVTCNGQEEVLVKFLKSL